MNQLIFKKIFFCLFVFVAISITNINAYALDATTANLLNQLGQAVLKNIPANGNNQQQSNPSNQPAPTNNAPIDSQASTGAVSNYMAEPYGSVGSLMKASYRDLKEYPKMIRLKANAPETASFTQKRLSADCVYNKIYKILEYQDFPDWRDTKKYVHLEGVQDSQCEGWYPVVGFNLNEKNIQIESDPEHSICPVGWYAYYGHVDMIRDVRRPDPTTLVCFAPKNTPMPSDFICKDWSEQNKKNPGWIHDNALKTGYLECSGGNTKMADQTFAPTGYADIDCNLASSACRKDCNQLGYNPSACLRGCQDKYAACIASDPVNAKCAKGFYLDQQYKGKTTEDFRCMTGSVGGVKPECPQGFTLVDRGQRHMGYICYKQP